MAGADPAEATRIGTSNESSEACPPPPVADEASEARPCAGRFVMRRTSAAVKGRVPGAVGPQSLAGRANEVMPAIIELAADDGRDGTLAGGASEVLPSIIELSTKADGCTPSQASDGGFSQAEVPSDATDDDRSWINHGEDHDSSESDMLLMTWRKPTCLQTQKVLGPKATDKTDPGGGGGLRVLSAAALGRRLSAAALGRDLAVD